MERYRFTARLVEIQVQKNADDRSPWKKECLKSCSLLG